MYFKMTKNKKINSQISWKNRYNEYIIKESMVGLWGVGKLICLGESSEHTIMSTSSNYMWKDFRTRNLGKTKRG